MIFPTDGTPRAAKYQPRFGASLAVGTSPPRVHLYPREQIYSRCLIKVPAAGGWRERARSRRFFRPVLSAQSSLPDAPRLGKVSAARGPRCPRSDAAGTDRPEFLQLTQAERQRKGPVLGGAARVQSSSSKRDIRRVTASTPGAPPGAPRGRLQPRLTPPPLKPRLAGRL